jgi:uncharacterized membrane protein (Fun14 family)
MERLASAPKHIPPRARLASRAAHSYALRTMSTDQVAAQPAQPTPRTFGGWLREMPRWKKLVVAGAVVLVVVGGVWSLTSGHAPTARSGGDMTGLSTSLTGDGRNSTLGGGNATADEPASKGMFRLGFSFLAGFCIGAFIRSTLKIAAIAFGFWLFLTFVLSYFGILVVDWTAMDTLWNRFAGNVEAEWGDFQRFITGSLPAAGLATAGFAVGLKRH